MNSSEILEGLINSGKITQEDVDSIINKANSDVQALAISIHSIICEERHTSLEEMSTGISLGCDLYAESKIEKAWEFPAHKKWFKLADEMLKVFQTVELCLHVAKIISEINEEKDADIFEFLHYYYGYRKKR